ncbi:hypothetical protein [Methylobacterium soli]|uniref:Chlor_Arch_YYY domain-containing protein n=2 Tax=Methylobacterium soli TaxID=553447 RepID=A0A6L3T3Y0_9HYPH|nr:hypothetical protein [Methylobacterium soli]KAB1080914.1 hypothetical protein F6X53_04305 [Methylobacterium soli]
MNGSAADAIGILAAFLMGVPLVLLPGYALAAASRLFDRDAISLGRGWLLATLFGLGLLPFLDSTLTRFLGLKAAGAANLILALAGLALVLRRRRPWRIDAVAGLLILAWIILVIGVSIDVDVAGRIYQPLMVIDLVKHAATTRAILETGAPPMDPFFAREGRVSYYYFFYTLSALVNGLGRPLVDARTAFLGLTIWIGIGLYGLLDLLLAQSGLVRRAAPGHARAALAALLPAAGLAALFAFHARHVFGFWITDTGSLNEQVTWWGTSLLWVPHHVTGLLAAWLGLLALTRAGQDRLDGAEPGGTAWIAVLVAATAFASCVGLSVWVACGAVATAALWLALLLRERDWRGAALLVGAGILSLVIAAPHLADLLANRADGGAGIALTVRRFGPLDSFDLDDPTRSLLRLLLLPLNYGLEFGVFAAGTILFWRAVPLRQAHASEVGRLLTLSALASLVVGTFLKSTIINNDLGQRALLFAQVSSLVWTVALVVRFRADRVPAGLGPPGRLRMPPVIAGLAVLGYVGSAYFLVWQRAYRLSGEPDTRFVNAQPAVDYGLRDAYHWAAAGLPASLVLQHNPAPPRAFAFGLYGLQPTGVADRSARLYGAASAEILARVDLLRPVFATSLPATEVRARAERAGIGAIVVSSADPAWGDPGSWIWEARAVYAAPRVRIIRVADL